MSMESVKWQDETVWPSNCPIDCNSLFSYKNVLLIHCPMCPFFTFNYKRLLEHLSVSNHSGTLECVFYRCNECKKISTSSLLLKEHYSEEHSNSTTKHSTPISCLGVQRFMDKKQAKVKSERTDAAQCIFCTYQGCDLPNHYFSEHNVQTDTNKLLKPALNSILNILSSNKNEPSSSDMQMSDGTLIVMPEEPKESILSDNVDILNSLSKGSRKRKMNPPIPSSDNNNNNGGVHLDESEESETNSDHFNNQFVSQSAIIDNGIAYDSPLNLETMSVSVIDSHMNNILATDDESSEHSSDESRPLNGDSALTANNYNMGSNNNVMSIFSQRMMRKRGRPPKISTQIFSKEEIENELNPHIESVGKIDGKDAVRIASGEPFSVVVPLSLLVSAFDTDGVQYLKNLIRFYYKPEQLALFAWDVTQKRGRPRTSITVCSDPNTNDVANINLQSLRQQPFVQASMRLIERMFSQAFPSNLPIFINRLLQSHRFYVYGTTGASSTTPAPSTNPLIFNDDAQSSPSINLPSVPASPYRDAEMRLSRFWITCPDSEKNVRLTSSCPPIRKHLLVCAYDLDPVRFFRNLVRSALPLDELLHATWKGRNTGRPRFISALPNDDSNDESGDDKRPLIEHPLVQAFLEFVPKVCGRLLPENLGPIIHQLLATVRKTHCNNGLPSKIPLTDF